MEEKNAEDAEATARVRKFKARSELQLALLWSLLGTAAIVYWDGFGLQWWQCFIALGIIAGGVHRSVWVGMFSFLGVAILWTVLVWIFLLLSTD